MYDSLSIQHLFQQIVPGDTPEMSADIFMSLRKVSVTAVNLEHFHTGREKTKLIGAFLNS
jgi:hypothetical protein